MSTEYSLKLQNIVPNIMHTSKDEKLILIVVKLFKLSNDKDNSKLLSAKAIVIKTNAIVSESLFEFEKNNFSR